MPPMRAAAPAHPAAPTGGIASGLVDGSEGGARVISFESDVGSGSVRVTEGTPTTIELALRS
jgi:hypothetical protein